MNERVLIHKRSNSFRPAQPTKENHQPERGIQARYETAERVKIITVWLWSSIHYIPARAAAIVWDSHSS
jgi:hypothetical protein